MSTVRKLIATSAALVLVVSSTAAAAAQSTQRINPWAILAATSGAAPAAVMCGSAAAATAQGPTGCVLPTLDAAAPPPAPIGVAPAAPPPAYPGVGLTGELLPFILWFGIIEVALATSGSSSRPNSPA